MKAFSFLGLFGFLLFKSTSAAIRRIDDTDPAIFYNKGAAIWLQEVDQDFQPWFNGSLSYSNAPNAWFNFSFTGVGLSVWVGKKQDRGRFLVTIDEVFAGGGDAFQEAVSNESAPQELFNITGLVAARHQVSIFNNKNEDTRTNGQGFLAIDFIQVDEQAATTTLAISNTNAYPTNTRASVSMSDGVLVPGSTSDGSSKAGIIGGVVGAVAGILLIGAVAGIVWLLMRRKHQKQARFLTNRRESIDENLPAMSEYSVTTPYTHAATISPHSPAFTDTINERQSFLPAGAGRYSIQHSVQGRSEDGQDSYGQDTDANPGLQPPSYDNAAAGGPSSPTTATRSEASEPFSPASSSHPSSDAKGHLA